MNKKYTYLASLVVISSLLLGACSSDNKGEKKEMKKEEVSFNKDLQNNLDFDVLYPDASSKALAKDIIGMKAPNIIGKTLDGKDFSLNDAIGKPFILKIASSTCNACMSSHGPFSNFGNEVNKDIETFTVFPNQTNKDVKNFLEAANTISPNYNKAKDQKLIITNELNAIKNTYDRYKVSYTPSFYFVNKDGYISFFSTGAGFDELTMKMMTDIAFGTNYAKEAMNTFPEENKKPKDSQPIVEGYDENGNLQIDDKVYKDESGKLFLEDIEK